MRKFVQFYDSRPRHAGQTLDAREKRQKRDVSERDAVPRRLQRLQPRTVRAINPGRGANMFREFGLGIACHR